MSKKSYLSYWRWFLRGSGDKPGYRRLLNWWAVLHLFIGIALAKLVKMDLKTCGNTVLFPLASIFIGLTFAWAGNAMVLMQTREIDELGDYHRGGFVEYVFVFQTAILVILVTLVMWGLAGLQIFDNQWPQVCSPWYYVIKTILFAFSSLTLRECWHVVLGAQWMLIIQREIRKRKAVNGKSNEENRIE